MLKKIIIFLLLLLIIPSISLAATRANQSWPASPLGTKITFTCPKYPPDTLDCVPGNPYFIEDINEKIVGDQPIDIPHLITYFYEWIIVLGGLAVFVAFIWAGLLLLTSVGDAGKMSQARKKMQNSLIGFLILLSSYLIFYTINPELTRLGAVQIGIEGHQDQAQLMNFAERSADFRVKYTLCYSQSKIWDIPPLNVWGMETLVRSIIGPGEPWAPPYRSFVPDEFVPDKTVEIKNCGELIGLIEAGDNFNDISSRALGADYGVSCVVDSTGCLPYDDNHYYSVAKVLNKILRRGVIDDYDALIPALDLEVWH